MSGKTVGGGGRGLRGEEKGAKIGNMRLLRYLLLAGMAASVARGATVWWEGEKPRETNLPEKSWFSPANKAEREKLSEGAWLSKDKPLAKTGYAVYDITAPEAANYAFWVRKFWKHGPFRWRFNDGPWQTCGRDITLADTVELRKHVCANWVSLGKARLPAGGNTLRIELLENKGAAAFDCFMLTTDPFTPRGKLKHGEKHGNAPEGWFAFEPDPDKFGRAYLDLRALNHAYAGEKGFLVSRGEQFVFQKDGEPVKFWAVNASPMANAESDAYFARHIAKLGVNMVRIHGSVFDQSSPLPETIDRKKLDRIHRFVAALKKEGVYTAVSFYFPLWFDVKTSYRIPGYDRLKNKKPFGLLFFHPRMQEIYKAWAKGLLRTRNPYTGKALADDPAVALVEIVNEDNYFFWTMKPYDNIPGEAMRILEERYGDWLKKKYDSLDKAFPKWKGPRIKGDAVAEGRAGLYAPWFYKDEAKGKRSETRIRDQLEFLTQDLRAFHERTARWFREELGVKCPLVASNWKTADERLLGALDKYTSMACETLDRHAYFGGKHDGEGASYSLRKGHRYSDRIGVLAPGSVPVHEVQYRGHTHIVSEYNWPMPNRYRADCAPLAAVYGSLHGTDGYFHFAVGNAAWENTHRKFSIHTPVIMGQFPAAALIFRRGYIKEAPSVIHEALSLANLYDLRGTAAVDSQNLDALRAADVPGSANAARRNALASCVGRITRTVTEKTGRSIDRDISPFVDSKARTVRSMTGELTWNYGTGFVKIDSDRAQGLVGFLSKAGAVQMKNLFVRSGNEYGSVLLVSLDGKPIGLSSSLLLQVMTEDSNHGWATSGDGTKTITDLGGPPMIVRNVEGTVTIRRPDAGHMRVAALDHNGYLRKQLPPGRRSGVVIDLLPDCLYYTVTRR